MLLPDHLSGVEGISELFFYTLDLLAATKTEIEPKKIVGQKVCVGIQANDTGTQRYINGYVSSFEMCGGDEEFNNYRAIIVPNVWVLTLNKNTRVFQNQTVTDVIKAVLEYLRNQPFGRNVRHLYSDRVLHPVSRDRFRVYLATDGAARNPLLLQTH